MTEQETIQEALTDSLGPALGCTVTDIAAGVILDALTAGGYAVVELPEPCDLAASLLAAANVAEAVAK